MIILLLNVIRTIVLTTALISVASSPLSASSACSDLPPSTLQVFYIKPIDLNEVVVPAQELRREYAPDVLAVRHGGMVAVSNVVGTYDIRHRIIEMGGGVVCDSPEIVKIGFGSNLRMLYIARPVATNECVRHKMLDHEERHIQVLNATVLRFIDEKRTTFQKGMIALKQTPAPSSEVAKDRWRAGLQIIVSAARQELTEEIRTAIARLDDPSLLADLTNGGGCAIDPFSSDSGIDP